jgi:hypothetical protein
VNVSAYAVYARVPHAWQWEFQRTYDAEDEAKRQAAALVDDTLDDEGRFRDAVVVELKDGETAPEHLPEDAVAPITARYVRASAQV